MNNITVYFIFINILNFILFTLDKQKAKKRQWRIAESWLFFISLIGGSLGGLLAMNIMKHKTSKISFAIVMPILMIVNFLAWYYLTSGF